MFMVTIFKKWVGGTWHGRSYFQKRVFEGYSKSKKRDSKSQGFNIILIKIIVSKTMHISIDWKRWIRKWATVYCYLWRFTTSLDLYYSKIKFAKLVYSISIYFRPSSFIVVIRQVRITFTVMYVRWEYFICVRPKVSQCY